MQITEVCTIITCPGRNYVVVKILTDEGVYGVGEGTLNGGEAVVAAVESWVSPAIWHVIRQS